MEEPIQRPTETELNLQDQEKMKLQQLLERNSLPEVLHLFLKEGVSLADILEMTDDEMKELGIKAYGIRKRLLGLTGRPKEEAADWVS